MSDVSTNPVALPGHRRFATVSIRVQPDAIVASQGLSQGDKIQLQALESAADIQHTDPLIDICGSKITCIDRRDRSSGAPANRKFIRGRCALTRDMVRASANELVNQIDARDVSHAILCYAQEFNLKGAALAEEIGMKVTKLKELSGLTRITAAVGDAIDASAVWPTRENLIYVSRGKDQADQINRWRRIEAGEKRSARRRKEGRTSHETQLIQLESVLKSALSVAQGLGDEHILGDTELILRDQCGDLTIEISELLYGLGYIERNSRSAG